MVVCQVDMLPHSRCGRLELIFLNNIPFNNHCILTYHHLSNNTSNHSPSIPIILIKYIPHSPVSTHNLKHVLPRYTLNQLLIHHH